MHDLIQDRIKNFWGYGSLSAPVWFIGMEEGLGPTLDVEELGSRFRAAHERHTVDMRTDMAHLKGHMKWFVSGAPIQSTWKYPIALYLFLKHGKIPDKEEIRHHQALILGDSKIAETSTIELMPLPSRNIDESAWLYGNSGVVGCGSRKQYIETYKPERIKGLASIVREHHPRLVIFYSMLYLPEWTAIIGEQPQLVTPQMYFAQKGGTAFCIIPQAQSFGMSYARLYQYAKKIREQVDLSREELEWTKRPLR